MKKMMMLTTTAYMSERFNRSNIEILESMGYEVHVVANFDKGNPTTKEVLDKFQKWVESHQGKCISISVTNNPFDMSNNFKAYKELIALIKEYKYEFIHCHTPVAGVLGRIVAHRTNTKVIYTAHGFHFFKGAPLINWLLYYPVEKFLSRWTDLLITINQEDYQRARKSFYAKRIEYIPGIGIDLEKFKYGLINKEEKRKSLDLMENEKMLFSVGELNINKNHEIVIKALSKINNPTLHYFIAGQGRNKEKLEEIANELGILKQIHFLGYRSDIAELLQVTDLYVFPSKREGLSVALMEAIACHVPIVCSDIRGNKDLIQNDTCRFIPTDEEQLIECIKFVEQSNTKELVEKNYEVLQKYDKKNIDKIMRGFYEENKGTPCIEF